MCAVGLFDLEEASRKLEKQGSWKGRQVGWRIWVNEAQTY